MLCQGRAKIIKPLQDRWSRNRNYSFSKNSQIQLDDAKNHWHKDGSSKGRRASLATSSPSAFVRPLSKPTHISGELSSEDDYIFLPPSFSSHPLFLCQQNPKLRRLFSCTGASDEIVSPSVISVVWCMPPTTLTI